MSKLNKKIEKLRAVLTTKEQADTLIKNLKDIGDFSEDDKVLMEEFKKIFHLGTKQLEVFVDELSKRISKLDEYSILYYYQQLLNSPFQKKFLSLIKEKDLYKKSPDILGAIGNLNRSDIQTPVVDVLKFKDEIHYDSIVTKNKVPQHVLNNIYSLTYVTNSMYGFNFEGSLSMEPLLYPGKTFEQRKEKEFAGTYPDSAGGGYMVADTKSWDMIKSSSESVYKSIESYLKEVDYKLFVFKKQYNQYKSDSNVNTTTIDKVERVLEFEIKNTDTSQNTLTSTVIKTDLGGNVFESNVVRAAKLKIPTQEKDIELSLHTVEGQLGGLTKIKSEPITRQ